MRREYLDWVTGPDTGVSSVTIWSVMLGAAPPSWSSPPLDPADFGRCHRLLARFPEWRGRLGEVAAAHPAWTPLVQHWDELEALYERELKRPDGKAPELYARMKQLRSIS